MPRSNELQGTLHIEMVGHSDPFYCSQCKKLRRGMADHLLYEDAETGDKHEGVYCPGCLADILLSVVGALMQDEHIAEVARIRMN